MLMQNIVRIVGLIKFHTFTQDNKKLMINSVETVVQVPPKDKTILGVEVNSMESIPRHSS